MTRKDDVAAWPNVLVHGHDRWLTASSGTDTRMLLPVDLRDYFAGHAISGCGGWNMSGPPLSAEFVAAFAYKIADAMLEERRPK